MGQLEVHAHLRIRPGQLEGFKAQAAEIVRLSREKDTQTLRCDFFIDEETEPPARCTSGSRMNKVSSSTR